MGLEGEMDSSLSIRNLDEVLSNVLKPDEYVLSSEISPLTVPGENYGSIMVRVVINIKNRNTKNTRTLHAAGKLIPDNEIIKKVFDTQVTYKCEFYFYASIVPVLDEFLKRNGFPEGADFIAPFYGGRLNLHGGPEVDENAIILLQNLKQEGYITGQKRVGLDIPVAQTALDSLAKFHASGIGLRHLHPDVFESKLKPHFYCFTPYGLDELVLASLIPVLEKSDKFSKAEVDVVKSVFAQNVKKLDVSEAWGTIIHYDSWVNNILYKLEGSKPVHSILVDFQVFDYGTPLNDVMFFLFSSIKQDLFESQIDNLLNYYYQGLISNLKILGVDISKFSRSSFDQEVKMAVQNYEYYHAMWMLQPIMHEAFKSVASLKDGTEDPTSWSTEHQNKVKDITRMCFDKGWL
ncbi:hypothetical protein HUJ04_010410 [Dendroctonus ponderosae]